MISIIIPTHNRCDSLYKLLSNIGGIEKNFSLEVIVVDNNSTDNTRNIAQEFKFVNYVFEKNTAFTKAREAGALNASKEILLFIDDDVLLDENSIREIIKIFAKDKKIGAIAGRIEPKFLSKPPSWSLDCQKEFNGWSLFLKGDKEKFVNSAAGPMIAVKKKLYFQIDGFEPDTIGVETNNTKKSFKKLYIGPGDYGLSHKIINENFKILYSPMVRCQHIIPEVRMSISFWRSRVMGEGQVEAITDIEFFKKNKLSLFFKKSFFHFMYFLFLIRLKKKIFSNKSKTNEPDFSRNELWTKFYKSYLDCNKTLTNNVGLSKYLWQIASSGISDNDVDKVYERLPKSYLELNNEIYFYDNEKINKANFYKKIHYNYKIRLNYFYFIFGSLIYLLRYIKKRLKEL